MGRRQRVRRRRDVAGILAAVGEDFDEGYVERWVEALSLADAWRAVRVTLDEV